MELDQTRHSLPADIDAYGVVRSTRDLPPAHYTFKIKNFSVLFEAKVEKCESGQFEVGGYQWSLVLKTNGKKNRDHVKDYISMYLAIGNQNNLLPGWEVNLNFKFFVFDQIRDKYLCVQDGSVKRFHILKTEWGFDQLLLQDTLNDPSKGYIVDNSCIFGVEIFVIKGIGMGECLSMINQPQIDYFTWRIDKFDVLKKEYYCSDVFLVEGHKWMLLLSDPRSTKSDAFLSLSLQLHDSEIVSPNRKVYAKFKLRMRDQVNGNHCEKHGEHWFCKSNVGCGFKYFLSQRDLKSTSKGFLLGDGLIIECKIDVISEVKGVLE